MVERQLRAFFSFSHRSGERLKPIFLEACKETNFTPVFAEENIDLGVTIHEKINFLISSCDLFIAVYTDENFWPLFELNRAQAIDKPFLIFVEKNKVKLSNFYYKYYEFENDHGLFKNLIFSLGNFQKNSLKPENAKKTVDEKTIIDVLNDSIAENVLVLGKDSDTEGLKKINQISDAVKKRGYEPIILKKLPEIVHLSLESKLIRVGSMCRFIIAEDSRASGHIDEMRLCVNSEFITASVREVGTASTWMQAHYPIQYNFMNRFCYENQKIKSSNSNDSLCDNIFPTIEEATNNAVEWAENRIAEQEKFFGKKIYSNF